VLKPSQLLASCSDLSLCHERGIVIYNVCVLFGGRNKSLLAQRGLFEYNAALDWVAQRVSIYQRSLRSGIWIVITIPTNQKHSCMVYYTAIDRDLSR
jgi:hypothetical protein